MFRLKSKMFGLVFDSICSIKMYASGMQGLRPFRRNAYFYHLEVRGPTQSLFTE